MIIKDNIQRASIDKLFPNTWNPNKQSDFIFEKEMNSIRKFGMLDPITVREIAEGFEIIDGEHRYRACKALGMTEVPINNMGAVSDSVAKQLTIVFNETKGKADRVGMSNLLTDLKTELSLDDLKLVMPFTDAELNSFLNTDAIDWSNLDAEPAADAPADDDEWKTVELRLPEAVADQFNEQVMRFKKALHPDDFKNASSVMAIEAIAQHLAQIEDNELI